MLFKESQESYSKKNQNVLFFIFSFGSNANTNRVILFYEQWQVCCIGSILSFFRSSNSIFQSYNVYNHTIPGKAKPSNRLNIRQLPFSISEKNAHDQFQRTICGRAGVEPATPGSAVRLALDARRLSWNVYMSRRMAIAPSEDTD